MLEAYLSYMEVHRKIIHVDMDAFFASVEQRDNPALRGKPIAVGGGSKRGVTTTASYEARKFGVRSAMPGYKARELCPHIIFVPPRFDVYKTVSDEIREVFREFTDVIEPLSFDEAFLDVTVNKNEEKIATFIARDIKSKILSKTDLTCSAGVSYCKFLAKVASGMNKPDGLTVIKPHQAQSFIDRLPIDHFFGVGKVTAKKMKDLGIHNGEDLKSWSKKFLVQHFGKTGHFFYDIARGIDDRPVQAHRKRKSIGVERTLEEDLESFEFIQEKLSDLVDKFYARLEKSANFGRTITLKLKTANFQTLTRSKTLPNFVRSKEEIREISSNLLLENKESFHSIRLIGLTASNLEKDLPEEREDGQMSLF